MENGEYPIFVTAGDGQMKLKHILHNQYLTYCYESLCNAEGSLVTFGFNFAPTMNTLLLPSTGPRNMGGKNPTSFGAYTLVSTLMRIRSISSRSQKSSSARFISTTQKHCMLGDRKNRNITNGCPPRFSHRALGSREPWRKYIDGSFLYPLTVVAIGKRTVHVV